MKRHRIAVVEDEEFTRALVVNALQSQGFDVVLESGSATYALKTATMMRIDAAVLDLDLGRGPTGLDLALGLRRNLPLIGIVFLTSFKDPRLLSSNTTLVPPGTMYLQKNEIGEISKIKRALERSIDQAIDRPIQPNLPVSKLGNSNVLTSLQIEITRLVAQGKSNQEIARLRDVTEKSIEQTLSRILKKVNIPLDEKKNRRVELALYYLRQSGVVIDDAN